MLFVNIGLSVLIGIIFILTGLLLKHKPPKNINALFGYRTPRSMKNIDLWKEANKYSAEIMIKYGVIMILLGSLISLLFKQYLVAIFLVIGLMLLLIIIMIIRVEKRLKQLDK